MQIITFVGKGAAGSTTVLARLATAAAGRQRRVIALDADLGFGNLDRTLNVVPSGGLADVLAARCSLQEAMQPTPWPGLHMVTSGVHADPIRLLTAAERLLIVGAIEELHTRCDLLMIDAGVSPNLFFFAGIADRLVLVMTPGRDTCGKAAILLMALAAKLPKISVEVLINRTEESAEGLKAFATLAGLCEATIATDLHYLGALPFDARLDATSRTTHPAGTLMTPETREAADRVTVRLLTPSAAPENGMEAPLR